MAPGPAGVDASTLPIHPTTHPEVDDARAKKADSTGMTFTDYLLDISLIGFVLLQVRSRKITLRGLLPPVLISAWAIANYFHGVPTAGNDLTLIALAAGLGITFGALAALFTKVTTGSDGMAYAKAGGIAAVLWIVGVGTRFAFQLYASHGGASAIARFSASHAITTGNAWVAALLLMALGEAVTRTALVAYRGYRVAPDHFLGERRPSMMVTGDRAY